MANRPRGPFVGAVLEWLAVLIRHQISGITWSSGITCFVVSLLHIFFHIKTFFTNIMSKKLTFTLFYFFSFIDVFIKNMTSFIK